MDDTDDTVRFARDLYQGTAGQYDKFRQSYPAQMLDDLVRRAGVSGHGRLLDLACGTGQLAFPLRHRFREVWAVDREADMVDGRKCKQETIAARTALYFTMIMLSAITAIAGTSTARQLARRLGAWNSAMTGGAAYLVVITIAMLILPSVGEVPADFPATALWNFRLTSLGIEAILWTALGLVFGALAERQLVAKSSRSFVRP